MEDKKNKYIKSYRARMLLSYSMLIIWVLGILFVSLFNVVDGKIIFSVNIFRYLKHFFSVLIYLFTLKIESGYFGKIISFVVDSFKTDIMFTITHASVFAAIISEIASGSETSCPYCLKWGSGNFAGKERGNSWSKDVTRDTTSYNKDVSYVKNKRNEIVGSITTRHEETKREQGVETSTVIKRTYICSECGYVWESKEVRKHTNWK